GRAIDEHLLADRILAGIAAEVDLVAVQKELEELLDGLDMTRLGGTDVVVVGDAHAIPEGAKGGGDLVGELERRDAGGSGRAFNLLAVLIGAGQKKSVVAEQAVTASDHVGRNGRVRMAYVRACVDI